MFTEASHAFVEFSPTLSHLSSISDVDLFTRSNFDEDNASCATARREREKHAAATPQLNCSSGDDMENVQKRG